MKSSDKPEISKKWWTSEKPADIKGADLEKALACAEKALGDEKKKSGDDTIKACLAALEALDKCVDKTISKECDKKKHKDVITVLEKYEDLIEAETSRLEDLQEKAEDDGAEDKDGKGEEEDDKGVLKPEYLARMIKILRSGKELHFCFGLNKAAPTDSRLVLCNKRKPERLYKIVKQTGDFSNRLLTYGDATGDGKILQFRLADDAKEPSQICKLAKEFLKGNKELKYKKIRVQLGGQTFEEDMPDAEGQEGQDGQGQPQVAAGGQPAPGGTTGGGTAGAAGADGAPSTEVQENLRKEFKQARAKWIAVRKKADQDIELVKDGVRDYYLTDPVQFPIAMKKIKELDEIMDNLNDDLRDALDSYVSTPLKQQDRLREMATNARQLLGNFTKYVEDSPLLTAIDAKEFADVQIKAPMMTAMRDLAKTIG